MPDPNDPLEEFYAAHPELRPGAAAGAVVGNILKPAGPAPATTTTKPPAAAPAGPPPPPAGAVVVSPGRAVANNGLTSLMLNPTTQKWEASPYPPNAADRAAAGIGATGTKTGGGSTFTPINFAEKGLQDKIATLTGLPGIATKEGLLSQGARPLGANLLVLNGDKYSLRNDGTGLYGAFGRVSATEARQLAAQQMAQNISPTRPAEASNLTPEARPFAGLSSLAGTGGTLGTSAGPVIGSTPLYGLTQYNNPGIGIPTGNNTTIHGVERGLNSINAGHQGSLTQFPVAPGFRSESQTGNSINFADSGSGRGNSQLAGSLEPQMLFGATSVTPQTAIPGSYQYGLGNAGDANRAYSVPFNIGPAGASLANIGGNNVQINAADRSSGTGYVLNASPASSVFAATGRNPSEDPASQAAQALMLNAAIAQAGGGAGALQVVNAANQNQFSGYHAGTGNGYFSGNGGVGQGTYWPGYADELAAAAAAGQGNYGGGSTTGGPGFGPDGPQYYAAGGRVATLPLGSRFASFANGTGGPKSMVTNGPKLLIDARTGNVDAVMGEDNADPGFAPNKERLTFSGLNNSMLNIKPLQPFATGGNISTLNPDNSGTVNPDIPTTGGPAGLTGGDLSGINLNGGSLTNAPPPPPDPNAPPPDVTPSPVVPPAAPPPPPPVSPYAGTPFIPDPNLLLPWQAAAQKLQMDNAARDAYRYRFTNAGLSGPKAIDVLQGDVPNQELAPGLFYDPSGQVNKVISDIIGTQTRQQELGAQEDMNPIQQRATYLGNALDDLQKIRDLEISKVAADTGATQDTQGTIDAQAGLQAALDAKTAINSTGLPDTTGSLAQRNKELDAEIAYWERLVQSGGSHTVSSSGSPGAGSARIQAQIDSLKARLPAGANEADLQTELALLRDRIAKNQSRLDLSQQVANLGKLGVPRLNAPVLQRTA